MVAQIEARRAGSVESVESTTIPMPDKRGSQRFTLHGMEIFKGAVSGLGIGGVISVIVGVGASISTDMSVAELVNNYPYPSVVVLGMPVLSGALNALLCNFTAST